MQRNFGSRHQKRRAIKQVRKWCQGILGQCLRRKNADSALTEEVIVASHVEMIRHWPVGDNHIQSMDGQIGQQRCQPSFAADQLDRLVAFQRRLNQPIGNHFRHGVGNTDTEGNTLLRRIVAQRLDQFIAQREDLFRVAEHALSGVGQFEASPDATEQFDAERALELAELPADRLRREVQLLAGARDASRLRNHPEVAQVLVVDRRQIFPHWLTLRIFRCEN